MTSSAGSASVHRPAEVEVLMLQIHEEAADQNRRVVDEHVQTTQALGAHGEEGPYRLRDPRDRRPSDTHTRRELALVDDRFARGGGDMRLAGQPLPPVRARHARGTCDKDPPASPATALLAIQAKPHSPFRFAGKVTLTSSCRPVELLAARLGVRGASKSTLAAPRTSGMVLATRDPSTGYTACSRPQVGPSGHDHDDRGRVLR